MLLAAHKHALIQPIQHRAVTIFSSGVKRQPPVQVPSEEVHSEPQHIIAAFGLPRGSEVVTCSRPQIIYVISQAPAESNPRTEESHPPEEDHEKNERASNAKPLRKSIPRTPNRLNEIILPEVARQIRHVVVPETS
jgi:hypothetical protein